MSWLFSQALVEAFSEDISSDGELSAPLNGNPTQQAYLSQDKMTDFSRLSRFGMTFKPLTDDLGAAVLTWCQEASRARTSQQQEQGKVLTESGQDFGEKWQGSFAKYNLHSYSWKTPQCLLIEDSMLFLGTWPRWGLMQGGECWEQTASDTRTIAPEFGWLPTPVASDWKGGCKAIRKDTGKQRTDAVRHYIKTKFNVTYPNPNFLEVLMGWPEGWTELKPLAMVKFQQWQQQHLLPCKTE